MSQYTFRYCVAALIVSVAVSAVHGDGPTATGAQQHSSFQPSNCVQTTFDALPKEVAAPAPQMKQVVAKKQVNAVPARTSRPRMLVDSLQPPVVTSVGDEAPIPNLDEVIVESTVPMTDEMVVDSGCSSCGSSCGTCQSCGSSCGHCGHGCGCCNACCQMPQHHAYFPAMHGYYYFRPYHDSHVGQQKLTATSWGEDPRAPYANSLFQRVYREYREDKAALKAGQDSDAPAN